MTHGSDLITALRLCKPRRKILASLAICRTIFDLFADEEPHVQAETILSDCLARGEYPLAFLAIRPARYVVCLFPWSSAGYLNHEKLLEEATEVFNRIIMDSTDESEVVH